jgi:hypothetical protein
LIESKSNFLSNAVISQHRTCGLTIGKGMRLSSAETPVNPSQPIPLYFKSKTRQALSVFDDDVK